MWPAAANPPASAIIGLMSPSLPQVCKLILMFSLLQHCASAAPNLWLPRGMNAWLLGHPKSCFIFIRSAMSPLTWYFPCMKAAWPFSSLRAMASHTCDGAVIVRDGAA